MNTPKALEGKYWVAKDENEARVIVALLQMAMGGGNTWRESSFKAAARIGNAGIGISTDSGRTCHQIITTDRTLSTIPELFALALNGWKEAWEVALEKQNLVIVTDEQKESHSKPSCLVYWDTTRSCFEPSYAAGWGNGWYRGTIYAVPADFQFERVPWVPKVGGRYFSVNPKTPKEPVKYYYRDDPFDRSVLAVSSACETMDEAIALGEHLHTIVAEAAKAWKANRK